MIPSTKLHCRHTIFASLNKNSLSLDEIISMQKPYFVAGRGFLLLGAAFRCSPLLVARRRLLLIADTRRRLSSPAVTRQRLSLLGAACCRPLPLAVTWRCLLLGCRLLPIDAACRCLTLLVVACHRLSLPLAVARRCLL